MISNRLMMKITEDEIRKFAPVFEKKMKMFNKLIYIGQLSPHGKYVMALLAATEQ